MSCFVIRGLCSLQLRHGAGLSAVPWGGCAKSSTHSLVSATRESPTSFDDVGEINRTRGVWPLSQPNQTTAAARGRYANKKEHRGRLIHGRRAPRSYAVVSRQPRRCTDHVRVREARRSIGTSRAFEIAATRPEPAIAIASAMSRSLSPREAADFAWERGYGVGRDLRPCQCFRGKRTRRDVVRFELGTS